MEGRMKRTIKTGIVVLCLFVFTVGAHGFGGFFIGLQAGNSIQKPKLTDIEFNSNTTFLYGLRVGVKFMMFSIEANYFQAAHNLELKELLTLDWQGKQNDYSYLGINAKLFFPLLIFQPYVTAGCGFYTADIKTIDSDTKKGINVGVGLEVHLGTKFSLLAEGKYNHVKVDIAEQALNLGDWTLAVGFNFYF
ncbi:MAG: porin family protein [Acidobacteria bacterium]|nr:porin family protein [Acidobacteriota bacterium]MBU1339388.1 porin family protein [Acidobacteriota bacterium]MBU1475536.1 porin family protein [Acidobacteriota bacterium]MBU2438930.1 porin family protein [Acidobacteriota bacterium]MBU4253031.1 porin family protein [Acidobacteriota bacterium]